MRSSFKHWFKAQKNKTKKKALSGRGGARVGCGRELPMQFLPSKASSNPKHSRGSPPCVLMCNQSVNLFMCPTLLPTGWRRNLHFSVVPHPYPLCLGSLQQNKALVSLKKQQQLTFCSWKEMQTCQTRHHLFSPPGCSMK